jgi:hypothetical protein
MDKSRQIFLKGFAKRVQAANGRLPLLTLDEFFNGNIEEESIAPNQWGYGRPTLAEMWKRFRQLEKRPSVAWVRVELHDDTSIEDGEITIAGGSIIVCTNASSKEIEQVVDAEWLCSDGAIDWSASDYVTDVPPVPEKCCVYAIVWD